jgi:hypothetical protein
MSPRSVNLSLCCERRESRRKQYGSSNSGIIWRRDIRFLFCARIQCRASTTRITLIHSSKSAANTPRYFPSENYWNLAGEEERLRAIAQWQQKAFVFEHGAALRQAEDQFRLLVEAVQDYAIFMLDPGGHVSTWKAFRVLC